MKTCYYCETLSDEGSYYCDDCHRWQCNTQECGCVCSMTDGDLYSNFTGDMTASEVLETGLENLTVHIAELWRDTGFMDGFQYKYMPHLPSDQDRIKIVAETIHEYAAEAERIELSR